jgi:hypothetical protein
MVCVIFQKAFFLDEGAPRNLRLLVVSEALYALRIRRSVDK